MVPARFLLAAALVLLLAGQSEARSLKSVRLAVGDDDPCACQPNGLEKVSGGLIDAENTPGHEHFVVRKDADGEVLEYLPGDYGESCNAWDSNHKSCQGPYAPAWCASKWCYVKKECKEHKDVKQSMYFPEKELFYSYNKCGSLDAFTSEACFEKKDAGSCGDPCAWNAVTESCQNKLCQCTGDNTATANTEKYEENILSKQGKDYGEKCHNWDQKTCPAYERLSAKEGGAKLGLWCCKDWCYVPEECPSAKKNSYGLHYSYYACPDDAQSLATCPWKKAITYDGKPLPLTSSGAQALNDAHNARPKSSARSMVAVVPSMAATLLAMALHF